MKIPYRIETSIKVSQEQYDRIVIGSIPQSMDDHWFVYSDANWIYCHRSWTGYLIFKCQIHHIGDNRYEITEIIVEREVNRYGQTDDKIIIEEFELLIDSLASRRFQNHIRSGILGLVVGDALGVPVEFISRARLKERPVNEMIGYGTHNQPAGTWSDDSSMALCLAEELIEGFNLQDIADSFVRWLYGNHWRPYGKVFDVGIE